MSYFGNLYNTLKYPISDDKNLGLRNAQIGAIHSIASFFTIEVDNPGIIVMPTGSGKTVVLMMSPFVLKSNRILIITPSKLVRGQIFDDFSRLKKLIELNILDKNTPLPKIKQIFHPLKKLKEWNELKDYDIVIGTPNCLSPGYKEIANPPKDLFDLIIFDESHHMPARTWKSIHEYFKNEKQLFFTATPFRRDRKEIIGKFIYTYPLSLAAKDNIFGKIKFVPVDGSINDIDGNIAKKVQEIYLEDKKNNFEHSIIIRTDSKKRAKEIEDLYKKVTKLKVKKIDSDNTFSTVKKTIEDLKNGQLDGIICVNMFGEGFDFPNLKIAGIHTPHKSLEVTLQFIGRFARTTAKNVGEAKFVGSTNDIEHEGKKLYDEDVNWNNIISNISDLRLFKEKYVKDTLEKFSSPDIVKNEFKNLSFSSLLPYFHIKIFRLSEDIDIKKKIEFGGKVNIEYLNYSEDLDTTVYIISEVREVKWVKLERYDYKVYDLIIIHFDSKSKLLVINSSKKDKLLYEHIVTNYTNKYYKQISTSEVNNVLNRVSNFCPFNIGLSSKTGTQGASYKTILGSTPHKSLTRTDANTYDRAHVMGTGVENGQEMTIGYSKNAKVWSNTVNNIPNLLRWINNIIEKIDETSNAPLTGTNFDIVNTTETVSEVPKNIIALNWNNKAFEKFYFTYPSNDETKHFELKDLELTIDESSVSKYSFDFSCKLQKGRINFEIEYTYNLKNSQFFSKKNSNNPDIIIRHGERLDTIEKFEDFLNEYPLSIYTSDFQKIEGKELSKYTPNYSGNLDGFCMPLKWSKNNVDIKAEVENASAGLISIHDYYKSSLPLKPLDVVIYDHSSGEIADFITIKETATEIDINLYHCKGSGGAKPGSRVNDIYEIVGQGIKSLTWIKNEEKLFQKIIERVKPQQQKILRGDFQDIKRILNQTNLFKQNKYTINLIQPGISKKGIKDNTSLPVISAYDFFKTNGIEYFLYCSD